MNKAILCNIASLHYASEEAYLISINWSDLESAIVLFSAFKLDIINNISLVNRDKASAVLVKKKTQNKQTLFCVQINDDTYITSSFWLDTVLSMLIKSKLYGWSQTDHVDQDFGNSDRIISLCVSVNSP